MSHLEDVRRVYRFLDEDRLEQAALACLRIARLTKDYLQAAVFQRMLNPEKMTTARVLANDMSDLDEEVLSFVWKRSVEIWLELISNEELGYEQQHLPENDRKTVYKVGAGEIDLRINLWTKELDELSEFDRAARGDTQWLSSNMENRRVTRDLILTLQRTRSRFVAYCSNYATQIERQFAMQDMSSSILWEMQNQVNNFFKERSQSVYDKLQKAAKLYQSNEAEDASLLLTEVRRVLKAVADYFFPADKNHTPSSDGKGRKLTDDAFLNRIEEYLRTSVANTSSKELIVSELNFVASLVRKVSDKASKGVHAEVRVEEARHGYVAMYMFLNNLRLNLLLKDEA